MRSVQRSVMTAPTSTILCRKGVEVWLYLLMLLSVRTNVSWSGVDGYNNAPSNSGTFHRRSFPRLYSFSTSSSSTAFESWAVPSRLHRDDAQSLVEKLLPSKQYGDRIGLGRQAQDIHSGVALSADDPRLTKTYAEFPLPSLDILLDAAVLEYSSSDNEDNDISNTVRLVDIGSGLGRIVLYTALSRGSTDCQWHVSGIEISSVLHDSALRLMEEAMGAAGSDTVASINNGHGNSMSLHLGSVQDCAASTLLSNADIIFAYSTAFSAKNFSPELSALILDEEWSERLGQTCRPGCVAITTDRALDPNYGWKLLQQVDVENPEVFGSSGYIQVLGS